MVDLVNFDRSLKITWLQKILPNDAEWIEFACFNKIDRLVWSGENYHQYLLENINNPFWKSVAKTYKDWFKLLEIPNYPKSSNLSGEINILPEGTDLCR